MMTNATKEKKKNGKVIRGLAELPRDAFVDYDFIAEELGVTSRTIRRMVARAELPTPIDLGGTKQYRVGTLLDYLEESADKAAKESRKQANRIMDN